MRRFVPPHFRAMGDDLVCQPAADFLQVIEHNPRLSDGIVTLQAALEEVENGRRRIDYRKLHPVLAKGNFVLCVCEGENDGVHSAFYDLFRIADGRNVEHWDTTEKVAPRSEWKKR